MGSQILAVPHIPVMGSENTGTLPLTVRGGTAYHMRITSNESVGPAQHYRVGAEEAVVEIANRGKLPYGETPVAAWWVNAGSGEDVDATGPPGVPDQATSVDWWVYELCGQPGGLGHRGPRWAGRAHWDRLP